MYMFLVSCTARSSLLLSWIKHVDDSFFIFSLCTSLISSHLLYSHLRCLFAADAALPGLFLLFVLSPFLPLGVFTLGSNTQDWMVDSGLVWRKGVIIAGFLYKEKFLPKEFSFLLRCVQRLFLRKRDTISTSLYSRAIRRPGQGQGGSGDGKPSLVSLRKIM